MGGSAPGYKLVVSIQMILFLFADISAAADDDDDDVAAAAAILLLLFKSWRLLKKRLI